jgi:hypothetical protein
MCDAERIRKEKMAIMSSMFGIESSLLKVQAKSLVSCLASLFVRAQKDPKTIPNPNPNPSPNPNPNP